MNRSEEWKQAGRKWEKKMGRPGVQIFGTYPPVTAPETQSTPGTPQPLSWRADGSPVPPKKSTLVDLSRPTAVCLRAHGPSWSGSLQNAAGSRSRFARAPPRQLHFFPDPRGRGETLEPEFDPVNQPGRAPIPLHKIFEGVARPDPDWTCPEVLALLWPILQLGTGRDDLSG
jgi:hypothetical protein